MRSGWLIWRGRVGTEDRRQEAGDRREKADGGRLWALGSGLWGEEMANVHPHPLLRQAYGGQDGGQGGGIVVSRRVYPIIPMAGRSTVHGNGDEWKVRLIWEAESGTPSGVRCARGRNPGRRALEKPLKRLSPCHVGPPPG
jgi:hypothetical protein